LITAVHNTDYNSAWRSLCGHSGR